MYTNVYKYKNKPSHDAVFNSIYIDASLYLYSFNLYSFVIGFNQMGVGLW